MATEHGPRNNDSILGKGWSFPPEFVLERREVRMVSEAEDIEQSLMILFGTLRGERFLTPKYGLDMHDLVFEGSSTTMRSLLADRIKVAILVYEPRIDLLDLRIDPIDAHEGSLRVSLDYAIRATNSRYNLVFPFYDIDGNEVRGSVTSL